MEILSQPYLTKRLSFPSPRVRMWAAYQLAERWFEQAPEFVGFLLESEVEEIRESGVFLVGKQNLEAFAFPLFRVFNSAGGRLRKAAVTALAEMHYPNLERPLLGWVEDLLLSEEVNIPDLECAIQSLLLFDEEKFWDLLNEKAVLCRGAHIKSLALFGSLCNYAYSNERLSAIVQHYATYRVNFTDPQFLNYLLPVFGNQEIIDFVRLRMSYGYSVRLIYQECLNILGHAITPELLEVLDELDQYCSNQAVEQLPQALVHSLRIVFPDRDPYLEEAFLEAFKSVLSDWEATIIKIQDQEFFFLLSLPLSCFVKEAEVECLNDPEENVSRISRIYHSPLLRLPFMVNLINVLHEHMPPTLPNIPQPGDYFHDMPRDALWRLITKQVTNEDYPFSMILPNPWQYEIPFLLPQLAEIYKGKFDQFVSRNQHGEINYALDLFKKHPDEAIVELMLKHFSLLINQHFHSFFEFMEYVPDQRFIDRLVQHYRVGEAEIQQLIDSMSEIHQQPSPDLPIENEQDPGHTYVRILCAECHASYRYPLTVLYFDQEVLEQRRPFTNKDIWTTDVLSCKNCHAVMPFETSDKFRSNLYAEVLTARLLKLTDEEQKTIEQFKPLHFPDYLGKKTNPAVFLKKVKVDLESNRLSQEEQSQLLLELGKLYLAIERLPEAHEAFQKCLDLVSHQPVALFNLGVIAFRQKNLYDARLHFSRFLGLFSAKDFEQEEENLYEMANHYLDLLSHREFKRSTFRLIRS